MLEQGLVKLLGRWTVGVKMFGTLRRSARRVPSFSLALICAGACETAGLPTAHSDIDFPAW